MTTPSKPPKSRVPNQSKVIIWVGIASIFSLGFCLWGYYQSKRANNFRDKLTTLRGEYRSLKNQYDDLSSALLAPHVRMLKMRPKATTETVWVIIFWDAKNKSSTALLDELPTIEKEYCYQLWADDRQKIESVGMFSNSPMRGEVNLLEYVDNTRRLFLTVEQKGGALTPSDNQTVAEIRL